MDVKVFLNLLSNFMKILTKCLLQSPVVATAPEITHVVI